MYWKDKWTFPDSNEYEIKYAGRYGAKGEKRAKKAKATPEQIEKVNQRNREKKVRRLIKLNFKVNDLWCTLLYPAGTRKSVEEVKRDLERFLDSLRKKYKRRGEELKFIYRMEIGARGGIHIHILVNRIRDGDLLIQSSWKPGRVNYEGMQEDITALAEYIVKKPQGTAKEHIEESEDPKAYMKYSSSRNLIRPEPERKLYTRWTVRDLIDNGPKPTPGYYIDKDSIVSGVNKYTGMSYFYYTEKKVRSG